MPKGNDAASAPANQIFRYEVILLGIYETDKERLSEIHQTRYSVWDRVWIRHLSRRCVARSSLSSVTRVVSTQNVEMDGMPRHVRDLKVATSSQPFTREPSAVGKQSVAAEDE